jgi:hypothetical protein
MSSHDLDVSRCSEPPRRYQQIFEFLFAIKGVLRGRKVLDDRTVRMLHGQANMGCVPARIEEVDAPANEITPGQEEPHAGAASQTAYPC